MNINMRELVLIKDRKKMCNWCQVLHDKKEVSLYDTCKEKGGKCLVRKKLELMDGGVEAKNGLRAV